MAGLSDILAKSKAEGAIEAPSASLRFPADAAPASEGVGSEPSCFGFLEKLERVRTENPDARIDGYILFGSHADALGLFDAAKKEGYPVRISPTPRAARASCGVALLLPVDSVVEVCELAERSRIAVENAVALPKQISAKRDRYC